MLNNGTPKVGEPMRYQVVAEELILPEEYAGDPDAVRAITRRFTAALERLVRQIEARGSLVYFYSLPYAEDLEASAYARATTKTAHATFKNDQWLRLELPLHELRWADGVHLDERSSIVVAEELQKQLLLRNDEARRP